MHIVCEEPYRSPNQNINEDYSKMRITVDCVIKNGEANKLKLFIHNYNSKDTRIAQLSHRIDDIKWKAEQEIEQIKKEIESLV